MRTDSELDLKTRRSLLSRLRNLDDQESWRAFFDLYWQMLYRVARRAGLGEADAEDVVQETVVAVARQMPRYQYDTARGTFKGWLFRIVGRRVTDHLRRVYRQARREELPLEPEAEEDDSGPAVPEGGPARSARPGNRDGNKPSSKPLWLACVGKQTRSISRCSIAACVWAGPLRRWRRGWA